MRIRNIYADVPKNIPQEIFETIISNESVKLERILSKGHSTPNGQWYNQEQDEWVILLKGNAGLLFEGEDEVIKMLPGDYLHIPAHRKHRVEWTATDQETVWLAIHIKG